MKTTSSINTFLTGVPKLAESQSPSISISGAVKNQLTQQWSVQLKCGQFIGLGSPAASVVWQVQ